jgi:hypothetical protein
MYSVPPVAFQRASRVQMALVAASTRVVFQPRVPSSYFSRRAGGTFCLQLIGEKVNSLHLRERGANRRPRALRSQLTDSLRRGIAILTLLLLFDTDACIISRLNELWMVDIAVFHD